MSTDTEWPEHDLHTDLLRLASPALLFPMPQSLTPRCLWLLQNRESHTNMLSNTQYDPGAAMIVC